MKFSEKLQTLRKENKLSQEKLADMLDVSRQAVSKWESGQTYPEMDKLLSMCKIFGISLDELTNDEITEIGVTNKNKNTGSNLVDEALELVNRTCKIFRRLQAKDILKIIFEMFVVFLILLAFNLPIQYIYSLGEDVFMNFGSQLGNIFSSIFHFVLGIAYFIFAIIVFVYVYKIKVLDHYENLDNEEDVEIVKHEIPNKKEEIKHEASNKEDAVKKDVIIPKEHNYTIFKTLGSIVMAFIKFFVICMTFPFLLTLLFLSAAFIISIIIMFKGVFFFGINLGIIACIILNIVLLEIVFNFIFNKKNSVKRLFIMFTFSIAALGIATGITAWDVATIDYIEEIPTNNKQEVYEAVYEMTDNTLFLDEYYDNVSYINDNSLGNNIKVEISYYKDYSNVYSSYENNKYITIHQNTYSQSIKRTIDLILKDLSKRKLHLYNDLYNAKINIYATDANIQKLQENKKQYFIEIAKKNRDEEIDYYLEQIDDYQERLEKLKEDYDNKTEKLEEEKQNLLEEVETLKDKIKEYEEKIQEYRDSIDDLLKN